MFTLQVYSMESKLGMEMGGCVDLCLALCMYERRMKRNGKLIDRRSMVIMNRWEKIDKLYKDGIIMIKTK